MKPIDPNNLTSNHNYVNGAYSITNIATGKKYFGCTQCVRTRLMSHKSALISNKHPLNELQQDFNLLGINSFKFEVLKMIPLSKYSARGSEMNYIKHYKNVYNLMGTPIPWKWWDGEDVEFIKNNCLKLSIEELATALCVDREKIIRCIKRNKPIYDAVSPIWVEKHKDYKGKIITIKKRKELA